MADETIETKVIEDADAGGGGGDGHDAAGPQESAGGGDPARSGPVFRLAAVSNVFADLPTPFCTVSVRETEESKRQLTITIGFAEGIALSHAFLRQESPRPLTHEFFADILQRYNVELAAVRLVARRGHTYFAELELSGRPGNHIVSCRPSDALTLALRQVVPVPLLVDERLFEPDVDVGPWGARPDD